MSDQANLFCWNNQNLFSTNYLEHRLPESDLWEAQKEKAGVTFEEIRKAYESIRSLKLGPGEEAVLTNKFIEPVISALGFAYIPQPTTKRGGSKQRPDYVLFKDEETCKAARKSKDNLAQYFSHSLTILEAKYWDRRLNDTDKKDALDSRDPTAQTVKYLDSVNYHTNGKINWAILTNGKLWRLFYFRASSRSGNYFEVDLEDIILHADIDAFLYFYLFFSKDAFHPDPVTGKTWLDQHLRETEEYASRVSDKLKSLIFDHIFEGLASGFIEYRRGELTITQETDESLQDIFNGCLTLLYRLLFLLYAESRGLLPIHDPDRYYKKSLKKIKEDVSDELKKSGLEGMSRNAYDYWSRLESLFRIIDKGDKALNIPIYNGGLFETLPGSFIAMQKISDPYIAEAIELLTVDTEGEHTPGMTPFFDYSSLNVRHLGDIYEGLLEFHVRVAETDMVEIREKGKSLWKKKAEVKPGTKTGRPKKTGEVYIENSKHERRATGSYYTPHYIVEYIVANTVGPILKERRGEAQALLAELETLYEKQRKQLKKPADWKHWERPDDPKGKHANEIVAKEQEVFETLFDISVLDPAMGSGHFLVHTVDFISDKIITFLADYPDNPVVRKIAELREAILSNIREQEVTIDDTKLTEVNLIKRMVMKRCIYGVDLNEMAVELAKLSLWLDSFTLGAPLSFLDHHLKCGNSLIGVSDISTVIPMSEIFGEYQKALSFMLQVSELTDATISEAKKSYDLYQQGRNAIEPIRRRFDVTTAQYFMDMGESIKRVQQLAATLDFEKETYPEIVEKCRAALQVAEVKRFVHWQLEFPEVFYTEKGERENGGFDCVVGNPPYVRMQFLDSETRNYVAKSYETIRGKFDLYMAFAEKGIKLLKTDGLFGYIIPSKFGEVDYGNLFRQWIYSKKQLIEFVYFGDYQVFEDVTIYPCIPIVSNRHGASSFKFLDVTSQDKVDLFRVSSDEMASEIDVNVLHENIWSFSSWVQKGFHSNRLRVVHISLGSLCDEICKGIDPGGATEIFIREDGLLNDELLIGERRIIMGHDIEAYFLRPSGAILFPYTVDYKTNKFVAKFDFLGDKAKTHLTNYKAELAGRIYVKESGKEWFELWNQRKPSTQLVPKLIICNMSRENRFAFDEKGEFLTVHTVYSIILNSVAQSTYGYHFILAVLNSKLLSAIFRNQSTSVRGGYYRYSKFYMESLPIAVISFTTTEKSRKERVGEAIELYEKETGTGGWGMNARDILSWVDKELSESRNDTVHDFLAYLAEQMIGMNKSKNEEIKGFLKWLEREIGVSVDELQNKTAIKEYHKHDVDQLLAVLKKNKNKLSFDPSKREKSELLEEHFKKSMAMLHPVKAKIAATDDLIDEIVYKLYGLTQEEIAIVKGKA